MHMNKLAAIFIFLMCFSADTWGFGNLKNFYHQALEGDGKASNALCTWFDTFTDGKILDDAGRQLDTSASKIDQFCLIAAEKGFASSQIIVGSKYAGMQSKRHKAEAIKWFTEAANQGEEDAYSWLGELYAAHSNVERDFPKAVYWYTKAANSGDANAQCQLGFLHAQGWGTLKDNQQAKFWIRKGFENAKFDLTRQTCQRYWNIFNFGN